MSFLFDQESISNLLLIQLFGMITIVVLVRTISGVSSSFRRMKKIHDYSLDSSIPKPLYDYSITYAYSEIRKIKRFLFISLGFVICIKQLAFVYFGLTYWWSTWFVLFTCLTTLFVSFALCEWLKSKLPKED